MPRLSATSARIKPPVFADLQVRIEQAEARGIQLVPLHIGDTWLAPPAAAQQVLADLDAADPALYRYGATAGDPALRRALADLVRAYGLDVDPKDEVLIGNGGTHALFCAARVVLDQGDEVLMAAPRWPLAGGVFTSCGAVTIDVPITQRLYEDPSLDAGALFAEHVTARTKALYVISPNNPDGKVLSRRDLESIAALAQERDLWVFSDEVYAGIVFDREHLSIATLPGMRERTVVLHSMSKSHALAGCRVGAAFGPASLIAPARRVAVHTSFNVAVVMQAAALAALSDVTFGARAKAAYREGRDRAMAALAGARGVRVHQAEGGTFLFLDFAAAFAELDPAACGERPLLALLERAVDRGVLLAPGDAFGTGFDTCARLCTIAVPPEQVAVGVGRLRDALDAMRRGEP
ncbi:MAG: Aspartate aminotransferase [Labilithrix sp.]|nr:Aspartate aminotransferase [Labilithrix sp.]